LFGFTVIAASFASLTTELLQTHILTIIWGGLITQLTLVFATYIFSLGLGALVYKKTEFPEASFLQIQILLCIGGLLTPFVLLYTNYFLSSTLARVVSYLLIFFVGFVSGFEIPLLNDISEKNKIYTLSFENIMSLDYLGMSVACFLFSIFLIRQLGFWHSLMLNVGLSLVSMVAILGMFRKNLTPRDWWIFIPAALFIFAVVLLAFFKTDAIRQITTGWITG
jgi:predicted membrane-bound spermidine synthase